MATHIQSFREQRLRAVSHEGRHVIETLRDVETNTWIFATGASATPGVRKQIEVTAILSGSHAGQMYFAVRKQGEVTPAGIYDTLHAAVVKYNEL